MESSIDMKEESLIQAKWIICSFLKDLQHWINFTTQDRAVFRDRVILFL